MYVCVCVCVSTVFRVVFDEQCSICVWACVVATMKMPERKIYRHGVEKRTDASSVLHKEKRICRSMAKCSPSKQLVFR